jgi:hypothetical protein
VESRRASHTYLIVPAQISKDTEGSLHPTGAPAAKVAKHPLLLQGGVLCLCIPLKRLVLRLACTSTKPTERWEAMGGGGALKTVAKSNRNDADAGPRGERGHWGGKGRMGDARVHLGPVGDVGVLSSDAIAHRPCPQA